MGKSEPEIQLSVCTLNHPWNMRHTCLKINSRINLSHSHNAQVGELCYFCVTLLLHISDYYVGMNTIY